MEKYRKAYISSKFRFDSSYGAMPKRCQNGAFFPSEPIPCGLPGPGPQRKSAETSGTQGSSDQVIRVSYV